ncbi:jerky protein homolog-like [Leptopilina heterotoma]|uniref:jerky protein homolog-like n=1 Tax=Leptopilina heterotoma TaxID=63436 RepID=UPI001CA95850|nr:jerky protein homolog-like [Leptopilina heterotoma]
MKQRRNKTCLDLKSKIEVLRKIRAGVEKSKILKEYKIGETTYYKFMRDENELMNKVKKQQNKHRKTFRKIKSNYLDDAVLEWFQQARDRGDPVSGPLIRERALILNEKLDGPSDFKASNGWLITFKKRYNIRHVDLKGDKHVNDSECIKEFSSYLKEKIITERLLLENIYNADEAGIYWRTILSCSAPEKMKINNNECLKKRENRITMVFCSNAGGTNRIPLFVIGKSDVTAIQRELQCHGDIYTSQESSWMNQEIFEKWFTEIFIPRALAFQRETQITGKILLILDNAPCHPPLEKLNSLNENVEVINLPPNIPATFQPMAQGPISLTKKYYKKNFLRQLIISEKSGTIDDYLKNFNHQDCLTLLTDAWKTIKNSTLERVWKLFLDYLCLPVDRLDSIVSSQKSSNSKELLTNDLEFVDVDCLLDNNEDATFPGDENANDLERILLGPHFMLKNPLKILRHWYETDTNDCGWKPLTDVEIVNLVKNVDMNGKINGDIESNTDDSENSSEEEDEALQMEEITSKQAYESLQTIKKWIRENVSPQGTNNSLTLGEVESLIDQEVKTESS